MFYVQQLFSVAPSCELPRRDKAKTDARHKPKNWSYFGDKGAPGICCQKLASLPVSLQGGALPCHSYLWFCFTAANPLRTRRQKYSLLTMQNMIFILNQISVIGIHTELSPTPLLYSEDLSPSERKI